MVPHAPVPTTTTRAGRPPLFRPGSRRSGAARGGTRLLPAGSSPEAGPPRTGVRAFVRFDLPLPLSLGSWIALRSRKTSRIGVPSNPNASRSRFSR